METEERPGGKDITKPTENLLKQTLGKGHARGRTGNGGPKRTGGGGFSQEMIPGLLGEGEVQKKDTVSRSTRCVWELEEKRSEKNRKWPARM